MASLVLFIERSKYTLCATENIHKKVNEGPVRKIKSSIMDILFFQNIFFVEILLKTLSSNGF